METNKKLKNTTSDKEIVVFDFDREEMTKERAEKYCWHAVHATVSKENNA